MLVSARVRDRDDLAQAARDGRLTYALSDVARTALFIVPALVVGSLRGVLLGAVALRRRFGLPRCSRFWREFGRGFRIDVRALAQPARLRAAVRAGGRHRSRPGQLPPVRGRGALRRGDVRHLRVGCLQIPLVDLIVTSTVNVMMVKMAELARDARHARRVDALARHHRAARAS